MNGNQKCVLITGGAGYIGSHTAVELIRAGFDVVLVDDLSNSEASVVDRIRDITGIIVPLVKASCLSRPEMESVFNEYDFESVIHFAAFKSIGESVNEPLKYYDNNINSFINILSLMRDHGRPYIVLSSSASVYGQPDHLPATERSPRKASTSPYGNTKQICEDILRDSVAAYGQLEGISLRYFNPVGAHPSALIGELPRGVPTNLVPLITRTAAGLQTELKVFGNDYNTTDGTCLRDYIDITDLARAHVSALGRLYGRRNKQRYEIFNIGTGSPRSVMELIRAFEKANGIKIPFTITGRRPGDAEAVWADTSLARAELGWQAKIPLEQTMERAWAWEKKLRGIN